MCIYVFQSSSLGNVKRVQLSTATVLNWHQLNLVHIQKGRFLAQFGSMVHVQEHSRNKRSFVHHGHTDMNVWNLRCFVCYTVILLVLIWWCGQMILQWLQGELYEAWQVFLSSFKSGHWYLPILIIITIASCCGSLMKPLLLTSHYIDDSQLGTFPLVESQTEHHCQHWHHCE